MNEEKYGCFVDTDKLYEELKLECGFNSYGSFEKIPEKVIKRKAQKVIKKNDQIQQKKVKLNEKKARLEKVRTVGLFHSISIKLVGIISAIVILSLGTITVLVSRFVSEDTQVNAEENNLTINRRTADDCENRIFSVVNTAGMFFDHIQTDDDVVSVQKNSSMFFERNKEIGGIYLVNSDSSFINKSFFISREIDSSLFEDFVHQEKDAVMSSSTGITKVLNASPVLNIPALVIITPLYSGTKTDVGAILFSSESLSESFGTGSVNSSMLLNEEGIVLVHPDIDLMMNAADLSENKLVAEMISSKQNNRQLMYTDEKGEQYFGAFRKVNATDCGVITEVKASVVFDAVKATTRRNIYLTIAILAIAVFIIRIFARSISAPLELLTEVTDQIARANFDTPLFDDLNTLRNDEIGVLNRSTRDEQQILNTVTSLTNRGVTEAIVQKKIDFEPHLKDITIFFSDIRGFTAISDGFNKRFGEKSAAEIISFLNDYMSRMVNCIKTTGGNVDKFEGDAIMACWGVLRDDDLSFELLPDSDPKKAALMEVHTQNKIDDALAAIKSTIGMRYALMKYNKDAQEFTEAHKNEPLAQYKPQIKIGCGLNSGRVTVGFMGSRDKMEFTSIGDAVNLASRTESSNKPCGTDILITEDTYNLLKMNYIRCEENNFILDENKAQYELIVEQIPVTFEVKGKGKQHFYGVVNMPNFDIEKFFRQTEPDFVLDEECKYACGPFGPVTLDELRRMLNIPKPDFNGVNLDAEENKVKIN